MNTVLGIDLGTQSVKALVYDYERKSVVATASAILGVDYQADGSAEQNAADWLVAVQQAMDQIDSDTKRTIAAIGVSGQQHGFVALDETNQVLRPVKLWCDTSTEAQTAEIINAMGGKRGCIELTGNLMMSGYTAPKVLHLKQTQPNLYHLLDCILLPHDYLNFWLTGEKCMELGDASGTGFLNIRSRDWSQEALNAVDAERDLIACLPKLNQDNQTIGQLTKQAALELGLNEGIPVSSGGGDNMMGALGTGNVANGNITVSLGTSGTVYAYHNAPVIDQQGEIAAFCSSNGGWLPLLCTMNCTVTTELFRNLLNVELSELESLIASAPIGAEGLTTLPFFNGERSPSLAFGSGAVVGMSNENLTHANLLRSGMEGATMALRAGIDRLETLGVTANNITLTGGGSKSATWRQMCADVMQMPVKVMSIDEGAAYGAALQAYSLLEHDGVCNAETLADHLDTNSALDCEPEDQASQAYAEKYSQYQRAVTAIAGLTQ